jgi:hypothetical protein
MAGTIRLSREVREPFYGDDLIDPVIRSVTDNR